MRIHTKSAKKKPAMHKKTSRGKVVQRSSIVFSKENNLEQKNKPNWHPIFCLQNAEGLQIFSTMSETKAAFAERTIRSTKNKFHRNVEDYG